MTYGTRVLSRSCSRRPGVLLPVLYSTHKTSEGLMWAVFSRQHVYRITLLYLFAHVFDRFAVWRKQHDRFQMLPELCPI